jgi:hypothetical protein
MRETIYVPLVRRGWSLQLVEQGDIGLTKAYFLGEKPFVCRCGGQERVVPANSRTG